MDMADDTEDEIREPPRRMSAMGFEIEPELEAPLLGTLGPPKSQSRLAPILVLLGIIHRHCHCVGFHDGQFVFPI
uniref:Uncharacterized protein n=1 Tax=Physcomitrium patens TaxID=3218 RepID=A0A7I4AVI0_PHYPA